MAVALAGVGFGLMLYYRPAISGRSTIIESTPTPRLGGISSSNTLGKIAPTFTWQHRGKIKEIPDRLARQSAYAMAIWTEARGSLTQCLILLRALPFSDQRGTEQLLAAQIESLPEVRLEEEIQSLIQWEGYEGKILLGTAASLLAGRNPGKIRQLVESVHSSSTSNSKFRLASALLNISPAGLEYANDALKLTENTKQFASVLQHTAQLVSGNPDLVRGLFKNELDGDTHAITQLRSASLPFAQGIPISEKIEMLRLIDSDEMRYSTARLVGRFAEVKMDDLRSASQSTQKDAVMVASGMLGPAWKASPTETSAILNEVPDSSTRSQLWDDLLRSWRDCRTREEASARISSSIQGLSTETVNSLRHAMDRIFPSKADKKISTL